jgi:hypothetical protein
VIIHPRLSEIRSFFEKDATLGELGRLIDRQAAPPPPASVRWRGRVTRGTDRVTLLPFELSISQANAGFFFAETSFRKPSITLLKVLQCSIINP